MTVNYITVVFWYCKVLYMEDMPQSGRFTVCWESRHSITLRADNQKPRKNLKNTCHQLAAPFWKSMR